jgi:hypothetical protein
MMWIRTWTVSITFIIRSSCPSVQSNMCDPLSGGLIQFIVVVVAVVVVCELYVRDVLATECASA